MSALELRQAFRRRFRSVSRQVWSLHVGRGLARTVLAAALLLAAAAAADYLFELSWWARAGLLAATVLAVAVVGTRWVLRPARAWNRERVAVELEGLFPRLGQRIRTASEHGGRSAQELAREGLSPGMVAVLEEETAEKAKPLPFQAVLPVRPALAFGVLALLGVSAVVVTASWAPEWRTALGRMALASTPYTTLSTSTSADVVDEGQDVVVHAVVSGRARPDVVLFVRDTGESDWRKEPMEPVDGGYQTRLAKLRQTCELFAVAGPERTPVQEVRVRHALRLTGVRTVVTPPMYTSLGLATYDGGSFSAVQGSTARLRFELDRPPVSAALVVKGTARRNEPPVRIDLTVIDRFLTVELPLTADFEYSVEARDRDGMPLTANRHRVRVVADQAPVVWFETPSDSLEVHTLAEVLLRFRARDDFGLTKLGIVFQINNEEERTLVLQDVTQPNQQEAKAEQLLMLEQFLLTQKDCVAYYGFAEDNRPDGAQRTTTELRFIDIRPFQRIYRLIEPGEGGGGMQRDLIFLDEVIARQRFNLNQTIRLETRSKVRIELAEVEKVAAFENKLAGQTHDLGDFLAGLGVDGTAILTQAEEVMLSAVDSLNNAKFTTAVNQERDALRFLMEARNTIQVALTKQSRQVRGQARAFDRLQRQKLRRPADESEMLARLAEELAKLGDQEDEVARVIAGPNAGGDGDAAKPTEKPKTGDPDPKLEPKSRKGSDPAQDLQDEVAGQAAAIDKIAATAKGLTDLAKKRIGEAAKVANSAADALGQGDRPTARKEVDRAKDLFRIAARHVAALAADEAALQLSAARDLANDVAAEAAPGDPMKKPGAGGDGDKKIPVLGAAAEQAKTLKDVLEKLAGSTVEGDAEAARRAGAILKQEDLGAAIARLERPGADSDRAERQDLADRFAAVGQKLDRAFRETVAPRLEEIARLEREANDLEKRASASDDPTEMRQLRQQAAGLVEKLDAAGLGGLADEELRSGLKAGSSTAANDQLGRGIRGTHVRLLSKLQDFLTGDKILSGKEAVPPEYKDLVERYLRALSAGGTK